MNSPEISVILPVYNSEQFVASAIESVLKQTFSDFELIVIDDCSTDSSMSIASKYKDNRIRIIANNVNRGIGAVRRIGAENARGKYISYLSADDMWDKTFLEKMLQAQKKAPDTIIFCAYYIIDDSDYPMRKYINKSLTKRKTFGNNKFSKMVLEHARGDNMFVNYSALLGKREYFVGKYGFQDSMRFGEDLYHLLKLVLKEKIRFTYIPDALAMYRWHPRNTTSLNKEKLKNNNKTTMDILRKEYVPLDVPKRIFFFWGSKKLSYLRFESIASFAQMHHGWDIIVILRRNEVPAHSGWLEMQDSTYFKGRDYMPALLSAPFVKIQYLEDDYREIADMGLADAQTSDMLKWYILANIGGVMSDMDIIFFKTLDYRLIKDSDASVFYYSTETDKRIYPVGFMAGRPNKMFRDIYGKAIKVIDRTDYQSIGTNLLSMMFKNVNAMRAKYPKLKITHLPTDLIYPWVHKLKWHEYCGCFFNRVVPIPKKTIGIHWYGGSPHNAPYNDSMNSSNYMNYDNTISVVLAAIHIPRATVVNYVLSDYNRLVKVSEALYKEASCHNFDYIVVKWCASEKIDKYLLGLKERFGNVCVAEYYTDLFKSFKGNIMEMYILGKKKAAEKRHEYTIFADPDLDLERCEKPVQLMHLP